MNTNQIQANIATLERIRGDMVKIRKRTDRSRAKDLVDLRRELALTIQALSESAAEIVETEQGRRLKAAAFSKLALHQASHSAVTLLDDDPTYAASAAQVDIALKAYSDFVVQQLRETQRS